MNTTKQTPNEAQVLRLAMHLWKYDVGEVVETLPEEFSEVVAWLYPNGFEPVPRGEIHQALAELVGK